jgi:PAS domain S-box-containing protein
VRDEPTEAATVSTAENGDTPAPADLGLLAVVAALPGPTAVFAADPPHFTLLAASDALVATTGRPREALVGLPLAEAFPDPPPPTGETTGAGPRGRGSPEGIAVESGAAGGLARLRASLEAALRTGAPQRMARQRYDLERPDGTWEVRYWDALNTPVRGAGGTVRAVLHQTEDVTERVRAGQAAARAEVRAARVLERMRDAHLVLDRAFRVTYVNAAAEHAAGKTRGEMLGRTHWEVFPASVDNDAGRAYRRVAAEGVEQHVVQHYVGEGYDRHLEIDAYPTDEGEGPGHGVAIFWRDVTTRVRAEAALRATEGRYRTLFESIDEGFCVIEVLFDGDGPEARPVDYRFLETNPAFVAQAGLQDAVGHTVRELVPGVEQHWIDTYGRVAATGQATRFQMGSEAMGRWFDVYAFRVGEPAGRRVALLFTDVSTEKAAQRDRERLLRELAVERERLAYVFRQAPTFLAVLRGPDHVFTLVNDAYYQLVGHRDILGKPAFDALPEVRDQGFKELLDGVLATGRPFIGRELPLMVQRTAGAPPEERYVDLAYMPLVEADAGGGDGVDAGDADGRDRPHGPRVTGVIAHGSDVTAQVLARREVERLLAESERARADAEAARAAAEDAQDRAEAARREAAEASQAKSAFLATMSHELRTPINAMIGYTQLLDLGLAGPLTDQQRGYLERLTASSQHLLGLVNDVLDLSKIEAGEARVAHHDATTGPAVRAALDLVRPQAAAKGVRLVDARPDELGVPYVGDDDRMRQVVLNLLSNAVKFTRPGGTVTVGCDTADATPVAAGYLRGEGPWAYVRVSDTGVGIAPEEQARIFDPFHQVEGGHTRVAGGTGLGLAISRRLARLMGGDLTVESTPGAGATFTLWLPAARVTGGAQVETADARSARAEREAAQLHAPGLGRVGELLRASVDDILAAFTERLRADPAVPAARALRRIQLEDHQGSFLADLAQSLVIVDAAGDDAGRAAAEELRDGSAIQRAIAEAHGARRFAQGFDEAALRRDHQLFRQEVERAVRGRLRPAPGDARDADVDAAVHILLGLVDRAEALSVRAWRRAADAAAARER